MSHLSRILAVLLTTAALGACGSTTGATRSEQPASSDQSSAVPDGPHCDPAGCKQFCMNMRCMYGATGTDTCMSVCTDRCGDAFFESADAAVMACVNALGPSLDCEGQKKCCADNLTNQLCAR